MILRVTLPAVIVAVILTGCGSDSAPRQAVTVGTSTSKSTSTSTSGAVTDTGAASAGAASVACGDKITPHPAVAQRLPNGFPTIDGWTATAAVTQGKTLALRGAVRGGPDDIIDVRDAALKKLTASGYTRAGSDQEPGFEADADFSGPHPGNINVKALCRDNLVVTYTFEQ
jgi:hypothetical protein